MHNELTTKKQPANIRWPTSIVIALLHIGTVAAFFVFSWEALLAAILLWWISASLGVGMCFHRLLTHRGYKTPRWVEYLMTVCGTLALEGGPINWVVTHRIHHAHADAPGDPHTPRDGGWWAHIGWMLRGTAQQYDSSIMAHYAPDLLKDRFHAALNRVYWLPLVLLSFALLIFGGWSYLLWAVFFRITFNLHATWMVNSVTHMWGTRRFSTGDDSRNNWWVALLTFGEGWHNNHHAYPTAARHGLAWYEIDLNWWGIRIMQLLGLARSIKLINLGQRFQPEVGSSNR